MNTTLYYYGQGDGTKENLIHSDTIRFHIGRNIKQKSKCQPIADIESIMASTLQKTLTKIYSTIKPQRL